jgi:hypothetical protein
MKNLTWYHTATLICLCYLLFSPSFSRLKQTEAATTVSILVILSTGVGEIFSGIYRRVKGLDD